MKKEGLAITIILFVILGSVLNLRYLKSLIHELDTQTNEAVSEAEAENWTTSEALASDVMMQWMKMDKYTHVFIRHGEIDAVTDAFCSLLGAIKSRDTSDIFMAQLTLHSRLNELVEMERVTPGSIL